jgi:hypothetical protein
MTTEKLLIKKGYLYRSKETKIDSSFICTTAKFNEMIEYILNKYGKEFLIKEKHIINYVRRNG